MLSLHPLLRQCGQRDDNHLLGALFKRPFRLAGVVVASEFTAYFLYCNGLLFNGPVSQHLSGSNPWFSVIRGNSFPIRFLALLITPFHNAFDVGARYNNPLWSIQTELYGSFLVFIFLLLFRKSRFRAVVYAYALWYFGGHLYQGFFLGIMLADFSHNYAGQMESFTRDAITYPLLALGLLLGSYPRYLDGNTLAHTFYGSWPQIHFLGDGYAMLGALVVFASLIISRREQRTLTWPVFAFLGRISFGMYAFHFLLLGSFSSWLFLHLVETHSYNQSFAITFGVSLVLLIPLSYHLGRQIY